MILLGKKLIYLYRNVEMRALRLSWLQEINRQLLLLSLIKSISLKIQKKNITIWLTNLKWIKKKLGSSVQELLFMEIYWLKNILPRRIFLMTIQIKVNFYNNGFQNQKLFSQEQLLPKNY